MKRTPSPTLTALRDQLRRDQSRLATLHIIREEREDHLHDAQMLVEEIIDAILLCHAEIDNAYEAIRDVKRMERLAS